MDRNVFVLLAGEPDLSLWPMARLRKPGFLMQMPGGGTVLQRVWETLAAMPTPSHLIVVSPEAYVLPVTEELGNLAKGGTAADITVETMTEPVNRGPFNSLGLAMAHLTGKGAKGHKDPIVTAIPANLFVALPGAFAAGIGKAIETAIERNAFVTLVSQGAYPEPDYNYMRLSEGRNCTHSVGVTDKPGRPGAIRLLNDGEHAWGTGLLTFKASVWWRFMGKRREEERKAFQAIRLSEGTAFHKRVLNKEYAGLKSMDLWEGIIKECAVPGGRTLYAMHVPGDSWVLLNGWRSMGRLGSPEPGGNLTGGPVLSLDCSECLLESTRCLLVAIGLQNVAVVASDDVVLICNKDRQDDLRNAMNLLRTNGMHRYL